MLSDLHKITVKFSAYKTKIRGKNLGFLIGADYGDRTRHLDLGKVALYQMS